MRSESRSRVFARSSRFIHSAPVVDLIVAVIAFGLTLGLLLQHRSGATRGLDPLGGVLAAIASFPLLAHRRAPLTVLSVTTAAHLVLNTLGYPLGPPFGATIAVFYVAADERTPARPRETAAVLAGLFALHVGVTVIARGSPAVPVLSAIIVWGGAWIVGDQVRQRRQRRADLEDRARRAERDLERERRLAAAEERTRIARDLHDSAAHAINVILVQAGAARLLQRRDPAAATRALTTVEDVARETIGEIDKLVRRLRDDGTTTTTTDAAPEAPTGLAAVQTLAERHRAAGQEIRITVAGRIRPLAPGLDQAAFRILQESLTNAARHGSGRADVAITFGDAELALSVSNPATVTANGDRYGGHGILGMRERASLLGGTLRADRRGDGFQVDAHLPYAAPGVL